MNGWVLGHYSDFGCFRDIIAEALDGARYPLLMTHEDCDGEWLPEELPRLRAEVLSIAKELQKLPPRELTDAFEHTTRWRRGARNLYECFHNVDGENLFDALAALCDEGIGANLPIKFQ